MRQLYKVTHGDKLRTFLAESRKDACDIFRRLGRLPSTVELKAEHIVTDQGYGLTYLSEIPVKGCFHRTVLRQGVYEECSMVWRKVAWDKERKLWICEQNDTGVKGAMKNNERVSPEWDW